MLFVAGEAPMPEEGPTSNRVEREESQLWRWALGLLVLLAAAVAALSWEQLKDLPYRLWAIPAGLFLLAILFATYAFGRKREVSELKQIVKGFQNQAGVTPSEEQLDQLGQMIMRSQRNFKELIDSLDDAACAASLDGTLRTVNKRVSQLAGVTYSDLVGHKIYEFLEEPTREDVERGLGRFLEKKHWAGTLRIRLKNSARQLYFDCVLNGIVKGDEVVGVSMLGRDVTEQREKELRFTELFETLQEGVYFSTPEGRLLDANPALVNMLGYSKKEELLSLEAGAVNFNPSKRAIDPGGANHAGGAQGPELTLRPKDGGAAICL